MVIKISIQREGKLFSTHTVTTIDDFSILGGKKMYMKRVEFPRLRDS